MKPTFAKQFSNAMLECGPIFKHHNVVYYVYVQPRALHSSEATFKV